MTIKNRILAHTPSFFKRVRNVALILGAVSATILTAPVALPAIALQIAGYVGVSAAVATVVSQAVTGKEKLK